MQQHTFMQQVDIFVVTSTVHIWSLDNVVHAISMQSGQCTTGL